MQKTPAIRFSVYPCIQGSETAFIEARGKFFHTYHPLRGIEIKNDVPGSVAFSPPVSVLVYFSMLLAKPAHHAAKATADFFYQVLLALVFKRVVDRPPGHVLEYPLAGEFT